MLNVYLRKSAGRDDEGACFPPVADRYTGAAVVAAEEEEAAAAAAAAAAAVCSVQAAAAAALMDAQICSVVSWRLALARKLIYWPLYYHDFKMEEEEIGRGAALINTINNQRLQTDDRGAERPRHLGSIYRHTCSSHHLPKRMIKLYRHHLPGPFWSVRRPGNQGNHIFLNISLLFVMSLITNFY